VQVILALIHEARTALFLKNIEGSPKTGQGSAGLEISFMKLGSPMPISSWTILCS
jgi:hypothetical protein